MIVARTKLTNLSSTALSFKGGLHLQCLQLPYQLFVSILSDNLITASYFSIITSGFTFDAGLDADACASKL